MSFAAGYIPREEARNVGTPRKKGLCGVFSAEPALTRAKTRASDSEAKTIKKKRKEACGSDATGWNHRAMRPREEGTGLGCGIVHESLLKSPKNRKSGKYSPEKLAQPQGG